MEQEMKVTMDLETGKVKEFKPKPWLKKPEEEKKVQGYYYVKAKFKEIAQQEIDKLTEQWR